MIIIPTKLRKKEEEARDDDEEDDNIVIKVTVLNLAWLEVEGEDRSKQAGGWRSGARKMPTDSADFGSFQREESISSDF